MTRNTPKPRTTALLLPVLVVLVVLALAVPAASAAEDDGARAMKGSWLDTLERATAWITHAVAAWLPTPSALWGQTGHIADPDGTPSSGQTETTGGGGTPPTDALWGQAGGNPDPDGTPSSGQTETTGGGTPVRSEPGAWGSSTP